MALQFQPLAQATTDRLNSILKVGSLVSNPIDGGFGVLTSADNYMASIEAMQPDPNVDIVLLQEALPRERGSDRAESYIRMVEQYAATNAKKPIAFVTPTSHGHTDYSRALRANAPACLVPAGSQQGAARDRQRRSRREDIERIGRAPAASPAR